MDLSVYLLERLWEQRPLTHKLSVEFVFAPSTVVLKILGFPTPFKVCHIVE